MAAQASGSAVSHVCRRMRMDGESISSSSARFTPAPASAWPLPHAGSPQTLPTWRWSTVWLFHAVATCYVRENQRRTIELGTVRVVRRGSGSACVRHRSPVPIQPTRATRARCRTRPRTYLLSTACSWSCTTASYVDESAIVVARVASLHMLGTARHPCRAGLSRHITYIVHITV